jgi:hypothetical protein
LIPLARNNLARNKINDTQREVWRKTIEVFEDGRSAPRTVALFAEEQTAPIDDEQVIQVRLKDCSDARYSRKVSQDNYDGNVWLKW